jgi:hypothetical protein
MSLCDGLLWTWRFAFRTIQQPRHQLERVSAKSASDADKFHDVEPAFASFVFGNKRLRLLQTKGQGVLGQAGGLARANHKLAESGLIGRMDGFADTAGAGGHQPHKLIPSSDYPKKG